MFAGSFFLGITPTLSGPLQCSPSIPAPNDIGYLVIGIAVPIVVLIMIVISSLIGVCFLYHKRKASLLIMDSKVLLCVCVYLCMPSSLSASKICF